MSHEDLDGQVAVVTGAGGGIGRAVAEDLASCGVKLVLVDFAEGSLPDVVDSCRVLGTEAEGIAVDVGDEAAVIRVGSEATRLFGPVTAWINNAGITRPAGLLKMSTEDFEAVFRVHSLGTFLGMRTAARLMVESKTPGSIINVTSAAGLMGTIGQVNYAGAKGSIVAMTKSAARELGRYNIRVNAVAPAAATPMTEVVRTDERFVDDYLKRIPLGRWAEPAEVARVFTFLASPSSSYMTGQVVSSDGGMSMVS